jgi:hypothetical protein
VALSVDSSSLSSPRVFWDDESGLWVMMPKLRRLWAAADGASLTIRNLVPWGRADGPVPAIPIYTTGAREFPFGWRRGEAQKILPASSLSIVSPNSVGAEGRRDGGTVPLISPQAIKHGGKWWLFGTTKSYVAWKRPGLSLRPEASYNLRLFHSQSLLKGSVWTEVSIRADP